MSVGVSSHIVPAYEVVDLKGTHLIPEDQSKKLPELYFENPVHVYAVLENNESSDPVSGDSESTNLSHLATKSDSDNFQSSSQYEESTCNGVLSNNDHRFVQRLSKNFCKNRFFSLTVLVILIQMIIFSVTCLFFVSVFIEISSLKSQVDTSPTPSDESGRDFKELLDSISLLHETLNASMVLTNERYSLLESKTQQLLSTLESLGQPSSPAASCAALLDFSPSSPSGHYWVRSSNGSAVHVYCDMTKSCGNITGGWTRVSSINITENDTQCPGNLTKQEDSNTCGVEIVAFSLPHCSSVNFSINSIRYSKVCGKIKAFPIGSLEAFHGILHSIDHAYVDGISLTYGHPRQHIWTLAAGTSESNVSCPCTNNCQANSTTLPPSFVGKDYFCDIGSEDRSNPLWNGDSYVAMSTYSSSNSPSPPWFYRDLPHTTTEDIEMRVCVDEGRSNEDIAIETIEIYVQ